MAQLLHALLHSLPRSLGEPGSEAALGPPVGNCLGQRADQGAVGIRHRPLFDVSHLSTGLRGVLTGL
jgi:hypothetical protein